MCLIDVFAVSFMLVMLALASLPVTVVMRGIPLSWIISRSSHRIFSRIKIFLVQNRNFPLNNQLCHYTGSSNPGPWEMRLTDGEQR